MELQEATEKLKPFVSTNEYPNHIKAVAFADGYGYSTDGRIAVRVEIPADHTAVPQDFPLDSVKNIICDGIDKVQQWHLMDMAVFMELAEEFKAKYDSRVGEDRSDFRNRYTEVRCPCCGSYVYWDSDFERLVEDKEEYKVKAPRDMDIQAFVKFDDDLAGIVNFGYIYSIVKALGAELLWGCKKNGNASSYLVFKSLDGKTIQGIFCQEFARNDNIGTILFKKVERGEGNGSVNL